MPSERYGDFNEPKTFLYKAHDTVDLGGITYNILYEIKVSTAVFSFDAELGKVFLCRAPNGE